MFGLSVCGYHTASRKAGKGSKKAWRNPDGTSKEWQRRAAYDFTGCLAHVDITRIEGSDVVLRVIGYLVHNEACADASLIRFPPVPLHEHVVQIALKTLRAGGKYVVLLCIYDDTFMLVILASVQFRRKTSVY